MQQAAFSRQQTSKRQDASSRQAVSSSSNSKPLQAKCYQWLHGILLIIHPEWANQSYAYFEPRNLMATEPKQLQTVIGT